MEKIKFCLLSVNLKIILLISMHMQFFNLILQLHSPNDFTLFF